MAEIVYLKIKNSPHSGSWLMLMWSKRKWNGKKATTKTITTQEIWHWYWIVSKKRTSTFTFSFSVPILFAVRKRLCPPRHWCKNPWKNFTIFLNLGTSCHNTSSYHPPYPSTICINSTFVKFGVLNHLITNTGLLINTLLHCTVRRVDER
jgi:hypothetical protein